MSNYTSLWESLGLDMDRHDQLMAALGPMYAEMFLAQPNRPEAMAYYDFVVSEIHGLRVRELADHRKNGGKVVGTFCVFSPDEVIQAAGAIGVGLCAGSQFWVPDGEQYLPRNLCPLIKAIVGAKTSLTCPYFESADLIIGETTCDGKKKCWEILNEHIPVHVMNLPQMKREKDTAAWAGEIKDLITKIEAVTGNTVTASKLAEKIDLINKRRTVLQRLYNTRKASPVPISGKDCLLISQLAFFDDPARFVAKAAELCDELERRVADGIGVFPKDAPRVMIAGTPQAIPNWQPHHIIETAGAAVVCEETCTGTRYFENLVTPVNNDLEAQVQALAERYMQINCACFTPNEGRIDDVKRLAREYRVDGVIYYNLQFCHGYSVEYRKVERALKEQGIPVMMIETDYSGSDAEQVRTRVEAFLEMLR
ncbi:3-hydroxyacyl-ACP dehydratase [Clostridiales bacterium PH28_bin88]|nr:3-hydroxyacyl-ACP dehydratase [Clostridiales bacterium PH28_bin88]